MLNDKQHMKVQTERNSRRSTARRTDLFIFGLFVLLLAFILLSLTGRCDHAHAGAA
jgi:predicted nucleic acid-binding Zn ribbon protein